MNILVTGSNGQLGQELKKIVELYGNGHPNHNSDEKNYYIFTSHKDLDITKEKDVANFILKNNICVVVNCAAYTAVDKAEDEPDKALLINGNAPSYLAKACEHIGAVLIHVSTDYVFDGVSNIPLKPSDSTSPLGVYGNTKKNGEDKIVESTSHYIIIRTSWLYSGLSKNNFVYKMLNLLTSKDEVKVVYDQIGSPTNAEDLATFIYHIIENHSKETPYLCKSGTYHFANKGVTSWYDLTKQLTYSLTTHKTNSGNEFKIALVTPCLSNEFQTKAQRPHYSVLDTDLTEKTFDFKIPYWYESLNTALTLFDYNEFNNEKK